MRTSRAKLALAEKLKKLLDSVTEEEIDRIGKCFDPIRQREAMVGACSDQLRIVFTRIRLMLDEAGVALEGGAQVVDLGDEERNTHFYFFAKLAEKLMEEEFGPRAILRKDWYVVEGIPDRNCLN